MSHVATLISHPDRPAVTAALAERIARHLPQGRIAGWLAAGVAMDVFFSAGTGNGASAAVGPVKKLTTELRSVIGDLPVDVVLQERQGRRKKLLVADMDSTMIGQECIDELADYAGFKNRVASITRRAMEGELAFAPALRERVALLKGLPIAAIDKVIAERLSLTPGGAMLVKTMRAHGAYTCVVSGGFTAFMTRLSPAIGFNEYRANTLLVDAAGRLTGEVAEPVLGREGKHDTLIALRERLRLVRQDTLAVGDGANDIPMIEAAGLGIAFHAKPALREAAGACVDYGDLTALLYAQGYRREEFTEANSE
jgi:phosphoserine phosphatase